ncbi:hypothetical protein BV898_05071 [Hypsibius exemplaris]|uniref:Uncharacterized protein n=1 Tax=Hypsibius exemplaris TaxID=2072580 RepID=A0A1W0X0M1_HYPEX|nr:hypothetical protein BV898_05071 [Hypsibius exemplaris]
MKSVFFALCVLVAGSSCQLPPNYQQQQLLPQQMPNGMMMQARAFNDTQQLSHADQEARNAYLANQQQEFQQRSGAAVPLQSGSQAYYPQQGQSTGFAQQPAAYNGGQNTDSSLLKLLGSSQFMNILQPKLMTQAENQKLIPPLVTDGMKNTIAQQQQQQVPQQYAQQGYQPQADARQLYPQQFGGQMYPQQQGLYGGLQQQPMGAYGMQGAGSQLYPQGLGSGLQQVPLGGQYGGAGLNNGFMG